jgi:hypothetical protein
MSEKSLEYIVHKIRRQQQPTRRDQTSIIDSILNSEIMDIHESKIDTIKRYILLKDVDTLIMLCRDPRYGVYYVYKIIYESGNEELKTIIYEIFKDVIDEHLHKEGSDQKTIYPLKFQKYENQAEETRTEIL